MKKILVLMFSAVLLCASVLAFSSCGNKNSDDGGMHTHTMGEWKVESAADCVNDGKEVRTCTGEGCNHTERKTIPALGHQLTTVDAKSPSCVEEGHNSYQQCSKCTYNTYEKIDALGHDYTINAELNPDGDKCVTCGQRHICSTFEDWYTVKEADCTDSGTDAHKCTVCNAVQEQDTPKLDHVFDSDGKCVNCGDVKTDAPELPGEEFE